MEIPHALPDQIPGAEVVGSADRGAAFALQQLRLDCACDLLRDFVLNREYIGKIAIIAFGPKMNAGAGVDKLR